MSLLQPSLSRAWHSDARLVRVCLAWLVVARVCLVRSGVLRADSSIFRCYTASTGWRFNALILITDDMVVYRSWGGQPLGIDIDDRTHPQGLLQEMSPAVAVNARWRTARIG